MNPNMWNSIRDAKNAMALVPNTSSLLRPKGKSFIPENYSMKEVWRFVGNAIREGLAFRMGPLNIPGMTKIINLIK